MTATTDPGALYGTQTAAAIENFTISGEPVARSIIESLAVIKAEVAQVNAAALTNFSQELADAITSAADEIVDGHHTDQFPVDVFQTGSGTSTNMNLNEVIAALATARLGRVVHPNDHVNASQSTNDTFPTAIRLAALQHLEHRFLPALGTLERELGRKARDYADVVKAGRTHHMDATPVLLGDEFNGYRHQIRVSADRIRRVMPELGELPLGGTATGNGLNTPAGYGQMVAARLAERLGLTLVEAPNHFAVQGSQDVLVDLSAALRTLAIALCKIANDLRLMASGPRTGLGELTIPALQAGSSIMPGKANPVICEVVTQVAAQIIGNDAAVAFAGSQGVLELNAYLPVIARNLMSSLELLPNTVDAFASKCVTRIDVNMDQCRRYAEQTLATAAVLNPIIGYDEAADVVAAAVQAGTTLADEIAQRDQLGDQLGDQLDLYRIAVGSVNRTPTNLHDADEGAVAIDLAPADDPETTRSRP